MAGVVVKVKTNKKLEDMLNELFTGTNILKVGILAKPDSKKIKSTDAKKVRDSEGSVEESSTATIYDVAITHEFGDDRRNIPQRSFLRSTFEDKKSKIEKTATLLLKRDLKDNDFEPKKILSKLGVWFVGEVKNKFRTNDWDALEDRTRGGKNKEGRATPLHDTGQLKNSIDFQVLENVKK
jgi:hypothetical protein